MGFLNPNEMNEGGGAAMLDNVVVNWKNVTVELFDYAGKSASVCALKVDFEYEDEISTQYFKIGSPENWQPSDDGKSAIKVGTEEAPNKNTNFGILLTSLLNVGFPEDRLGDDVTELENLQTRMVRKPDTRPTARKRKSKDGTKEYDPTVLEVGELLKLPEDNKPAKSAPAGKPKGAGKKTASKKAAGKKAAAKKGGDYDVQATDMILELLAENEGTLNIADVAGAVKEKAGADDSLGAADRVKIVLAAKKLSGADADGWSIDSDEGVMVLN